MKRLRKTTKTLRRVNVLDATGIENLLNTNLDRYRCANLLGSSLVVKMVIKLTNSIQQNSS
jgi:hypothetical protein